MTDIKKTAGTANGPTPANTSQTASPGSNVEINLSCSVCNREFQYTLEKSNWKRQLDSCCSTYRSGSPARTSISNVRNTVSIESSLLTTVRTLGFLSRISWPMMCLYGRYSSRRFMCALKFC